jgi:hypothetical protein
MALGVLAVVWRRALAAGAEWARIAGMDLAWLVGALRDVHFRGKIRLVNGLAPRGGVRQARLFGYLVDLDLGDLIQRNAYLGTYEQAETAIVRRHLRPGGRFLDVGGEHRLFLADGRLDRRGIGPGDRDRTESVRGWGAAEVDRTEPAFLGEAASGGFGRRAGRGRPVRRRVRESLADLRRGGRRSRSAGCRWCGSTTCWRGNRWIAST